jgi:hypothetical protein
MLTFALTTLFALVLVQVFFLSRVADNVRRMLRGLIPNRGGFAREAVAALLLVVMVVVVFSVYLFGPAFALTHVFASSLSIPPSELGRYVPVFLVVSLGALGVCVKLWPKRFEFCGLTAPATRMRNAERGE